MKLLLILLVLLFIWINVDGYLKDRRRKAQLPPTALLKLSGWSMLASALFLLMRFLSLVPDTGPPSEYFLLIGTYTGLGIASVLINWVIWDTRTSPHRPRTSIDPYNPFPREPKK